MRIESIEIKNLRSIKHALIVLDPYTCFVGPNGAGKSTVLFALNVFFREVERASTDVVSLSVEDFHQRDITQPIEVTLTFVDLSPEAKEDFKDYFRNDKLIISSVATYDEVMKRAEVRQMGNRMVMPAFTPFFKCRDDSGKADELRRLYSEIQGSYPDLPAKPGSIAAMTAALRDYETARPEACAPVRSADEFYGVSKGVNRLEKHIQWVYIPAVKDATSEQVEGKNTALGKLLARTVRSKINFSEAITSLQENMRGEYQKILDASQNALDEISASLQQRIGHWAHPEATLKVSWQQDPLKSVKVEEPFAKITAGEGDFQGDLARFGHGFQRSFLLALLQELAAAGDATGPRLILGCEEPELYQHPPQARHLASVLATLAQGNSQILVSTHSPLFVAGEQFQNVRMVRRDSAAKLSIVKHPDPATIEEQYAAAFGMRPPADAANLAKIQQILQPALNEMFFTQYLVLVEGLEDIAYIQAWLGLTDRLTAFRKKGGHLVPTYAKNHMVRPTIIARHLAIPTFVIFDMDADKCTKEEHKRAHERDNRALLHVLGGDHTKPFSDNTVWGNDYVAWPHDLGSSIDMELKESLGDDGFRKINDQAHARFGNESGLKKNTMLIGAKLAFAHSMGAKIASLEKVCSSIVQ